MKRTNVEREIQRVMMEHELNFHPKPLSVTTCYPDVPKLKNDPADEELIRKLFGNTEEENKPEEPT